MITNENIFLCLISLLFIPLLIGNFVCAVLKKEKKFINYYVYGLTFEYALFEIISIPFILNKKTFNSLYTTIWLILIVLCIVGLIIRTIRKDIVIREFKLINVAFVVILICVASYFIKESFSHQVVNDDDSRFVVMAIDNLENNNLFLTNPATGEIVDDFTLEDSYKDIVSPWMVYYSFLSKYTKIKTVSLVHSILPISLYVYTMGVWWVFCGALFKKEKTMYQSMFIIVILLMAIFGNDKGAGLINNVFMKFLFRIWEGKSVVASAGIPLMYSTFFEYYKKDKINNIMMILIANLSICFMSANGIVIGAVMIGCFALAYSFTDFKKLHFLKLLPLAIPNGILYLLSNSIGGY